MTLEFAECLGACDCAPAVLVNDTLHENMTKEKVDELVKEMTRDGKITLVNSLNPYRIEGQNLLAVAAGSENPIDS